MLSPRLQTFMALHRAGKFAEAEAGYRDCRRAGIDVVIPLSALLLQQGRNAEAIVELEPVVAAQPENFAAVVNLSIALRQQGEAERALEYARRACELRPGEASACNARGLAALALDENEEALAALDAGLKSAPGNVPLELHRAKALRNLGRLRDALAAFERIVKVDPGMLEAWRDLGVVQARLGMVGPALASATQARNLAPGDSGVLLEYAVALLRSGRTAEAEQFLERGGGNGGAWLMFGQALLREGNVQGARKALERAHALEPDSPYVRHFRAALSGELPEGIESDYIRGLFDDFADRFESTLVNNLGYGVPKRLPRFLAEQGVETFTDILDLGCGTGLMGAELAGAGRRIDGVDLSGRMLAVAREKDVYRELHEGEVLAFLQTAPQQWDLIVAADVFIYIRALEPILAAAWQRLRPGGHFVFSIERSEGTQTQLIAETGRYRHHVQALCAALDEAGFIGIRHEDLVIRKESGHPVAGSLLLAQRPLKQA